MANLLSDTVNFITPFCRYMSPSVGTSLMPILGIANITRNIVLAAPMKWRFNRNSVQLIGTGNPPGIVQGVSDYTQQIADFGYLERASISDGTTYWELTDVKNTASLALSNTQARPSTMSVMNDDLAGNITFRLSAVPDKPYQINLIYQKAPVQFAALANPWAPLPDSFSDIYNNLCLGYYMDSCQDRRANQYISRGIASLLARAEGLSEVDKAVFASAYMTYASAVMGEQIKVQQGRQAQGAR